uniref:G protein-coupled receptor n=1 Tax=Steinernema glaseri TaxID=37863 RepID=A0A1I7ZZ50_9BILA
MLQASLWKNPCYKLMFYNGIIDVWGIINSCFITGYFAINGIVFCSYRHFIYLYGTTVMALWATQCMTVVLLALNRCIDFWQNPLLLGIFEGKRTYFCLLMPTIYFLCFMFFVPPSVYTSTVNMWALDPFLGIPDISVDRTPYAVVWPLNINNIVLLIALTSLYVFLICSIWYKSRGARSAIMNKVQRQITVQAFLICMVIYVTGGIYTLFEFFPTVPGFLMVVCFFSWQLGFGGTVLIYMVLNKSLRNGVIAFYARLFVKDGQLAMGSALGSSAVAPSMAPADRSKTTASYM